MRKKFLNFLMSSTILALSATPTIAAPTLEEEIQILKRQNHQQSLLLQKMQERLQAMEQNQAASKPVNQVEPVISETSDSASLLQAINDHVALSALIEVEGHSTNDFTGEDTSDINLATVEIGLDANLSEWSSGHLLLLYEEGEEDDHLTVDEGTITIGNLDKAPIYLSAGKMYVPFGRYDSNMISDPLTLEIGETGDSGVQIGFETLNLYGALYGYNGDISEAGDDDKIDNFGLNLGFVMAKDNVFTDIGVGYINNLGDTDAIGDFLTSRGIAEAEKINDYIDGFSAHASFAIGPFNLVSEYITALDDFAPDEIDFKGRGAEPTAFNVEIAFTMALLRRDTTFAVGYQTTDEALALELPETRYIGSASMVIWPYTALACEYIHDKDYSTSDGGTGNNADSFTVQLALEF